MRAEPRQSYREKEIKPLKTNTVMSIDLSKYGIKDVKEIIHQLSAGFTLLPGDVIMTGTPEGVGYAMQPPQTLKTGDVMELEIEGIGVLTNAIGD